MTWAEAVRHGAARLRGLESASFEARAMVARLLGAGISRLPALMEGEFPPELEPRLSGMIERRLGGEPLQYILGEWEFMGLPMLTEPCALIPRQDTETLCELALECPPGRALDLCCGTGCIGIALAKLGGFELTFADISPDCLDLARRNARLNGVEGEFLLSDLFENIPGPFGLICCNPPYIPRAELEGLQREVGHEPRLALDGGPDGLDFYRRIAEGYASRLSPGGKLLLEVGAGQAGEVAALLGGGRIEKDLCGVERVVIIG